MSMDINFRRVSELRLIRDTHNNWIDLEVYGEDGKKIIDSPLQFFGGYRPGSDAGRENRVIPVIRIFDEDQTFKKTETHCIAATPVLLLVE